MYMWSPFQNFGPFKHPIDDTKVRAVGGASRLLQRFENGPSRGIAKFSVDTLQTGECLEMIDRKLRHLDCPPSSAMEQFGVIA